MTEHPQGTPDAGLERFKVRQKLTLMVNRYEVLGVDAGGTETGVICFAEQKRMAFKEQVTFYSDASKSLVVFGFKARQVMDIGATYDVVDSAGRPIGWFKKDFGKSLLRSTWHLGTSDGLTATGQERNQKVAILRRVWEMIPVIGEIPVPFLFHFDFLAPDGSVVLSSVKKAGIKDVYSVEVPASGGRRLDWRVAAAMAVALDALQSR
ncbi:MAG TPA: hypothetical protein VHM65_09520 [Candidatus Lustribacter sp.]|nr:hypothetical protein [Candidatus Lustribacter sp.]